jgi:hypothetical protein
MFDAKYKRLIDVLLIIKNTDSWINANPTILKGVENGSATIVTDGAVIVKSTLPFSIVSGISEMSYFKWLFNMWNDWHEKLLLASKTSYSGTK